MVYQEETLRNVIRSVTRNGRSIILTALLALILVYLFSIFGYLFFRDDFLLEVDNNLAKLEDESSISFDLPNSATQATETINSQLSNMSSFDSMASNASYCTSNNCTNDNQTESNSVLLNLIRETAAEENVAHSAQEYQSRTRINLKSEQDDSEDDDLEPKERACDSLIMCIITTMNHGLRNGGGIGDVLRSPSSNEPLFVARVIYDLLFFFVVIIIILNLIFGVIIDTFADLRSEKQQKEEILKNTCFICGKMRFFSI